MKYSKFLLAVAVSLFCSNLSAQNVMYQWRTYLAYNHTTQVAITKDKVYAVSYTLNTDGNIKDGALFSVSKSDKHIETYSKVNGLSDNSVVFVAYSQKYGEMLVAYENGNIDFIADNGQITNFPDIYRANLNTEKKLNDVLFDGDFAYLSYPFGIVKWSMRNMEVAETYFIGENNTFVDVKSLSILDGYFYAVAADKIYKAPTSGKNLVNFANWQVMTDVPEQLIPNVKAITYNSKLYLRKNNNDVYTLNNDIWGNTPAYSGVTNICTNDNTLFIISNNVVNCSKSPQPITFNYQIKVAFFDTSISKIWAAASEGGVLLSNLAGSDKQNFVPDGPATNECRKIKYSQERMYFVPGSRWAVGEGKAGHVMILENNRWKNIYQHEIQNATGGIACRDLVDIEIDRSDKKHFWVASFNSGLYEFRNDRPFMLYNSVNSGIESENATNHKVNNLFLDSKSRLWFSNGSRTFRSIIKYLEPDPDGPGPLLSTVVDVPHPIANSNITTPGDVFIPLPTNENIKFLSELRNGDNGPSGIFAFDDNGTPWDISDDRPRFIDQFYDNDGKLFTSKFLRGGAMDKKNNTLWVGTFDGPFLLPNPQKFLEGDYRISRVKIPRNDGTGLADYLLDGQPLLCITIDSENRKWIGTENNGVFLISEDGTKTIHHFTSENSPLLGNVIYDIRINEKTGEVFIATDKGIISYQSDATESPENPFKDLHAYPNPVRPEHIAKGIPVTIINIGYKDNDDKWLDSVVKIVDTAGNLVYETIAKGGMVTWDCKRKGGAVVSTGIYIAICTTKDGKHHATTKILIVN